MNRILTLLGRDKISFSKTVKNKVKAAVSYINKFEDTVAEIAIHNNYDYVVCGHIHQPCIKTITTKKGSVQYLNSGDWIENLTALEYKNKAWTIFQYDTSGLKNEESEEDVYKDAKVLFSELLSDFKLDQV
jgi:UDP-2,3-diacylglucosamine pyrophosphatase LpxH